MASADQTASLDSRSSKCGICLEEIKDPRLLSCLHSFCRKCINQLMLTSSSSQDDRDTADGSDGAHRRTVRCPLCRSICPIPKGGTGGLLNDVTRSGNEVQVKCHACIEEEGEGDGKATAWCGTCHLAYCNEHAMPHVLSNIGHSMSALSHQGMRKSAVSGDGEEEDEGFPQPMTLCTDHKQPLVFHCVACHVSVCGHCITIGTHVGHGPLALIEHMIAEHKEKVFAKVEDLERKTLPQVMMGLSSVDKVSKAFGNCAEQVREQIRAAGCRVIEAVDMSIAKKLQQVDDIELASAKVFDKKHDHMKVLAESVKSVVSFTDCLRSRKVSHEEMRSLLPAVEERVDLLTDDGLSQAAGELSACMLKKHDEDGIAAAVDALIGEVTQCKASATRCVFSKPGGAEECRVVSKGGTAAIPLQANDDEGEPLAAGGDVITSQWLSGPSSPLVEVTDYDNGRYLLTFTLQEEGDYELAVVVNGTRMAETISKTCKGSPPVTFDPGACDEGIKVREDHRHVAQQLDDAYSAILGGAGMKIGRHQWKVQVSDGDARLLGVADQSEDIIQGDGEASCDVAFCWNGYEGQVWWNEKQLESVGNSWLHNDVIHLHLDCDEHTLRLTNLRSNHCVTFENLPESSLIPFFCIYWKNTEFTLLE